MANSPAVFQPYTTDRTVNGLRIARNAMRIHLWGDDVFAHKWMCHHGRGTVCQDGCTDSAEPARRALYESEIEE